MSNSEFISLTKRFETLMQELDKCKDPKTRIRLLTEAREVIASIDGEIVKEPSDLSQNDLDLRDIRYRNSLQPPTHFKV